MNNSIYSFESTWVVKLQIIITIIIVIAIITSINCSAKARSSLSVSSSPSSPCPPLSLSLPLLVQQKPGRMVCQPQQNTQRAPQRNHSDRPTIIFHYFWQPPKNDQSYVVFRLHLNQIHKMFSLGKGLAQAAVALQSRTSHSPQFHLFNHFSRNIWKQKKKLLYL